MLDDDTTPTTDTSDNTGTPVASVPPKRVRVSALAKELGLASKDLLALLAGLGSAAKTASSTLDQAQADQARAAQALAVTATETDSSAVLQPEADVEVQPATSAPGLPAVVFQPPTAEAAPATRRRRAAKKTAPAAAPAGEVDTLTDATAAATDPDVPAAATAAVESVDESDDVREAAEEASGAARRRRRRGRRGRGGQGRSEDATEGDSGDEPAAQDDDDTTDGTDTTDDAADTTATEALEQDDDGDDATDESGEDSSDDSDGGSSSTRRRRRRRRSSGSSGEGTDDDPPNTVVHVREPKPKQSGGSAKGGGRGQGSGGSGGQNNSGAADDDGVKGVKGSTRLEARRQRRRDGRDTNRRRPPILSEAEFLARREAVDRVMAVRQNGDRTQIAVLEDDILVEHYVTRASATSYVGNVYLGRVQNVLPSMEAAFIDIGKGRNGVLYAGEVNWDAAGLEGKSRAIEQAMKSGDAVLVQVTKDPIGHKGARLTSQVSLPGRFLVYVPGGGMTGISRRLPDTERHRLKAILKKIVPEDAGVIVRTAAEGATEEDLTRDVERLQAEWASIEKKAAKTSAAPSLVHGEPDLAIRVVRDVFNEDFKKLVVEGDEAWAEIGEYLEGVAPDLAERAEKHTGSADLFHSLRVDEQLSKALDRKVWLPSGGSLVIDRTEAMTVVDVNTGKFVGSGGNLEQTVTRNNLEAAEEIVRQLRLRDVGGIVVIDFIDMVLESNRDLVLRRLTECLGRDRTKHQVAEVTSLGLVQMTRKRVGEGLLEAFSETCEVCHGRGVIVHTEPVEHSGPSSHAEDAAASNGGGNGAATDGPGRSSRRRRGGKRAEEEVAEPAAPLSTEQRTKALEAMSAIHRAANGEGDDADSVAELGMTAVDAVISGSTLSGGALAAEVMSDAAQTPDVTPAELPESAEDEELAEVVATVELAELAEPVAETAEPATASVAASVDTVEETAPAVKMARPRRRRAASRPAGPPVAAS